MANRLRELILFRHAKSEWKQTEGSDLDRPLSDKGKKQALKMGKWIKSQDYMPDLILVSPANRAQQTLRRICSECPTNAITVPGLYRANVETLKQILASAPNAERIMVIGHNPGFERLYRFLIEAPQDTPNEPFDSTVVKLFPTSALAHIILPQDWSNLEQGDGKLLQFMRPKDLPQTRLTSPVPPPKHP
ncbi:MAG: phosphoglycolate phosphatase [Gammaproteobacteria bacterium]|nr:phosphoglycolate phosphatase [Gammaproteobacteria bacterium]